jgi:hypothetical protein
MSGNGHGSQNSGDITVNDEDLNRFVDRVLAHMTSSNPYWRRNAIDMTTRVHLHDDPFALIPGPIHILDNEFHIVDGRWHRLVITRPSTSTTTIRPGGTGVELRVRHVLWTRGSLRDWINRPGRVFRHRHVDFGQLTRLLPVRRRHRGRRSQAHNHNIGASMLGRGGRSGSRGRRRRSRSRGPRGLSRSRGRGGRSRSRGPNGR